MPGFLLKPRIQFGSGSLGYLEQVKGRRACIVTEKIMVQLGHVDQVTRILQNRGIEYEVFPESRPDPGLDLVTRGLQHIIQYRPDLLIAIGGGSSIDAAKAIMYFCLKTKEQFVEHESIRKPWFVAIPTTSGTGSEVTSYSVITDPAAGRKMVLIDDVMLPDVAILDPDLTRTVPPPVIADTGFDVLTHALEAYVSRPANSFTDIYAEKAVLLVFQNLLRLYQNPADDTARENMHIASCMAGIAFNNAALGINHSLAHALGGRFHLPHGRSNALFLPLVIGFNAGLGGELRTATAARYTALASLLGLPAADPAQGARALTEAVRVLRQNLELPASIPAAGVERTRLQEQLPGMVTDVLEDMCTPGNPRPVSREDVLELYELAAREA